MDKQPALRTWWPNRVTGCVQAANDPSWTAQCVFLAEHGMYQIDYAVLMLLAQKNVAIIIISINDVITVALVISCAFCFFTYSVCPLVSFVVQRM